MRYAYDCRCYLADLFADHVGFFFKRTNFINDHFWAPAEKLVYFVLLPAMIIISISRSDLSTMPIGPMAFALLSMSICMIAIVLLIKPVLRTNGPSFTSVLQGATRITAIFVLQSEMLFTVR